MIPTLHMYILSSEDWKDQLKEFLASAKTDVLAMRRAAVPSNIFFIKISLNKVLDISLIGTIPILFPTKEKVSPLSHDRKADQA